MTAMHSVTLMLIKWMPAGWSGCLCAIHTCTVTGCVSQGQLNVSAGARLLEKKGKKRDGV